MIDANQLTQNKIGKGWLQFFVYHIKLAAYTLLGATNIFKKKYVINDYCSACMPNIALKNQQKKIKQ
jgi:hypothetical protein